MIKKLKAQQIKKIRPVLQMEATECGAASLAMILEYYGKTVTIEQLRRECGVSRNGVNAKRIALAALHHHLQPKALRVEMGAVGMIKTPAIIHWEMDHFLVLCGFDKRGAVIADPAQGLRHVDMNEFARAFTGIVIEFTPDQGFEKNRKSRLENDYIASCIRVFAPCLIFFMLAETAVLAASAIIPFLSSVYIDEIIISGNSHSLKPLLLLMLSAGFIIIVGMFLSENMRVSVGKALNLKINLGFMDRLLRLPVEFYSQRSPGELTARQAANMLLGQNIAAMLSPLPAYVLQALVYLLVLVVLDVHIALIGLVCALANIVSMVLSARKYEEGMRAYMRDMGVLQQDVAQTVDMVETIKSCGCEDAAFLRLAAAGTKALNARTKIEETGIRTDNLFAFLSALSSALVLIAGVWKILNGAMTAGLLIGMQALLAAMLEPVGRVVNTGIQMQSVKSDMARTNDVMHYQEDDKFLDEDSAQKSDIIGDIVLDEVAFAYNPLDEPLIKDFDLTIKKGGSVAITGGSGSGKSTLAKIIAGLFQETGGRVTFNGMARHEIHRPYFYSKTAAVSQSIRLFEGTVLDNITMWDETIPYSDVVKAAKAAGIHEDIIARKNGYRERVSENGKNFSGGQRQRIEIARALVKKPEILIMDEATSALDADTEKVVTDNIAALGITRVIVAHRLSTIRDCDEIIVMDNGRVAERGTHQELTAKLGCYYKLVTSQEV